MDGQVIKIPAYMRCARRYKSIPANAASPSAPDKSSQLTSTSRKMFASAALVALASSILPTALAHGGVLSYLIEGTHYQGWAVRIIFPWFFLSVTEC